MSEKKNKRMISVRKALLNDLTPMPRFYPLALAAVTVAAVSLGSVHSAKAYSFYNDNGWEVSLDTTVQYSNGFRVNNPSKIILSEPNYNDGDQNLKHGMISDEFEVVPVLNVAKGGFGLHVSAEAYINTVYLMHNQNSSASTLNYDVANHQDYAGATKNIDGENSELLDAFVYGSHSFGADGNQTVTLKVGRQTLLWGQSLFFTGNSIAGGQAPVDVNTALTLANPQAQQIFLPVGQAVASYQPTSWLTLQGYYQFEWRPTQLPGVGSYFDASNQYNTGRGRVFIGPASAVGTGSGPPSPFGGLAYVNYSHTQNPPAENGQFGLSAQFAVANYDIGLYALRFDAKTPNFYVNSARPTPGPFGTDYGTYYGVFKQDIGLYGASISTNVGPLEIGGEVSTRQGVNLFGPGATFVAGDNENSHPGFPYGNTLNGQASFVYATPGGLPLMPGGATVLGEVEAVRVMSVTNKAALYGGRTANAIATELVFSPTYYDVLPNLNISVPLGLTWDPTGRSEADPTMEAGTGVVSVGVTGVYKSVWNVGINYKDYLGSTALDSAGQSKQPLADRGYVAAFISRTF